MPGGVYNEPTASSDDEPPLGGTVTPLALQVGDTNSRDDIESMEFWASLGNEETRDQERNATGYGLHNPPGNDSADTGTGSAYDYSAGMGTRSAYNDPADTVTGSAYDDSARVVIS